MLQYSIKNIEFHGDFKNALHTLYLGSVSLLHVNHWTHFWINDVTDTVAHYLQMALSVWLLQYQCQGPDKGADIIFSTALLVKTQRYARAVTVWTCWHVPYIPYILLYLSSLYIHRGMCVRVYVVYGLLNIEQFLFNVVTAAHKCPFRHQLDYIRCNLL